MEKVGLVIRKINLKENGKRTRVTKVEIRKQLITLLKKLRKHDPEIRFQYSIESDRNFTFHTHVIVHYNSYRNLYKHLFRFIGGKYPIIKKDVINDIKTIAGLYGEIDIHPIWDETKFVQYINKYCPSETLF